MQMLILYELSPMTIENDQCHDIRISISRKNSFILTRYTIDIYKFWKFLVQFTFNPLCSYLIFTFDDMINSLFIGIKLFPLFFENFEIISPCCLFLT